MTELEIRSTTEAEDKYTFTQSSQISNQTGLIGYLRADMDTDGRGFFSTWNERRRDLKTEEFKAEFDDVINSLREEGDILHDRKSLAGYCYSHPQSRMKTDMDYYGVRADTQKYAYLMRLCPNRGEYNLYCYCYVKPWLDDHLKKASRGIRFITPNYKEKFHISDGEKVRISYPDGTHDDKTCRYIDDYHLEVGSSLYHICELAERLEQSGAQIIPLRDDLPEHCYSTLAETNELIILKKGESGYYRSECDSRDRDLTRALADEYNEKLGVTKAQESAMKCGSMFGWDVPGADPKSYDASGLPIKSARDRGDER